MLGKLKHLVVLLTQIVVKMSDRKEHWEKVFATKQENEVSWYQPVPHTSLQLFKDHNIPKSARIIDVGGGDSYLIDHLLELGYTHLTLLDISEHAINRIKARLGDKAASVTFIVSDILDFQPDAPFEVWHDRASFHFLTSEEEITKYKSIVSSTIVEDGLLFIGTFSDEGPLKCSGLEIKQYTEDRFTTLFLPQFENLHCFKEDHLTPFDTSQNFIFCSFKKKN